MKRLALIAIAIGVGLALWAGLTIAQNDPWWDPRSPQGQSYGVTYGTNLPTLANTGSQPTDGLLAVQIATGASPTLNMYDQSASAWIEILSAAAGGLTDDTIPVWDATNSVLEDTTLTFDGTDITMASGQILLHGGAAAVPVIAKASDPSYGLYWASGTLVYATLGVARSQFSTGGHIRASSTTTATPAYALTTDADTGTWGDSANKLGWSAGGGVIMTGAPTNVAGAGTDLVTISATLGIMDDAADIVRGLYVDLTNANHTAAVSSPQVYPIAVATLDTPDAQAYESSIHLQGGWDTHITFVETGATPPNNPPAGQVAMFVDDNADYSGGGGNDCVLAMIDSAGTITVVATMILNGACP